MSTVLLTATRPSHNSTDRYVGLTDRFAAQVLRRPDAVAVCYGASRLSYSQLDQRANRVAARLAAMDVGPESVVAGKVGKRLKRLLGLGAGGLAQ